MDIVISCEGDEIGVPIEVLADMDSIISCEGDEIVLEDPKDIVAIKKAFRMANRFIRNSLRPEDEDEQLIFFEYLRRVAPCTHHRLTEMGSVLI